MSNVRILTDDDFTKEVMQDKSGKKILVDFFAPWCGPCRAMAPILEELQGKIGDKAKVFKINTDESPKAAQTFNVMSIPTLIVFKDGQVADKMVGLTSAAELEKKLE